MTPAQLMSDIEAAWQSPTKLNSFSADEQALSRVVAATDFLRVRFVQEKALEEKKEVAKRNSAPWTRPINDRTWYKSARDFCAASNASGAMSAAVGGDSDDDRDV